MRDGTLTGFTWEPCNRSAMCQSDIRSFTSAILSLLSAPSIRCRCFCPHIFRSYNLVRAGHYSYHRGWCCVWKSSWVRLGSSVGRCGSPLGSFRCVHRRLLPWSVSFSNCATSVLQYCSWNIRTPTFHPSLLEYRANRPRIHLVATRKELHHSIYSSSGVGSLDSQTIFFLASYCIGLLRN